MSRASATKSCRTKRIRVCVRVRGGVDLYSDDIYWQLIMKIIFVYNSFVFDRHFCRVCIIFLLIYLLCEINFVLMLVFQRQQIQH